MSNKRYKRVQTTVWIPDVPEDKKGEGTGRLWHWIALAFFLLWWFS